MIFVFKWIGVVLVVVIMGFFFMVCVICLVFENVDFKFEEVVVILGVSCLWIYLMVMLFLMWSGVIVGVVFVFVKVIGEFGVMIIFVFNISG